MDLYWFRNDLRLKANKNWAWACKNASDLLCLYVLPHDWDRWSSFRQNFLKESVLDLAKALEDVGQCLYLSAKSPTDIFGSLCKEMDISFLYGPATMNARGHSLEVQIQKILQGTETQLVLSHDETLFSLAELPFSLSDLPKTFTPFRKILDTLAPNGVDSGNGKVKQPPAAPVASSLQTATDYFQKMMPSASNSQFHGGASAGLKRLHEFIWDTESIVHYKDTRNGMLRFNDSSKLSPWLALGCISPKQIYTEIKCFEDKRIANDSTYWMIFELYWRDYFRFLALSSGPAFFHEEGISQKKRPWRQDETALIDFEKWKFGETSVDFVDANMKELLHYGWMSNRGRQVVASYLAKELQVNWTWGAQWFEYQLIDSDHESNWGNWAYLAGVGVDPRDRKFNVERQAKTYDPHGTYRKKFLEF